MDDIELIGFVFIAIDIAIFVYVASIFYGIWGKKVYGLGQWYCRKSEPNKYWQVIIGFVLLAITVIYIRFWVIGPQLLGQ